MQSLHNTACLHTYGSFREERIHRRVIIQLNVIRSVHSNHRPSSEARWDSRSHVPSFRTERGKGKARVDTISEFGDDDERHGDASVRYPDVVCSEDDSREDAQLDEIAQRLQPLRPIEAIVVLLD
jgi:hypothetical protein